MPTTPRTHTFALLLAAFGPAALCVALLAVAFIVHEALTTVDSWQPTRADVAAQPVRVFSAGLLGVMIARWMPYPGAALATVAVLVGWVLVAALNPPTSVWFSPYGEFIVYDDEHVIASYSGSHAWHDVYLLCLGLMAAVAALLATPGPRRVLLVAGAVFSAGAAFAGWRQLP